MFLLISFDTLRMSGIIAPFVVSLSNHTSGGKAPLMSFDKLSEDSESAPIPIKVADRSFVATTKAVLLRMTKSPGRLFSLRLWSGRGR